MQANCQYIYSTVCDNITSELFCVIFSCIVSIYIEWLKKKIEFTSKLIKRKLTSIDIYAFSFFILISNEKYVQVKKIL